MKKAGEFIIDSALGEKKFELQTPQEEKIVLSIEEGAVPVSALKSATGFAKQEEKKSLLKRLDEGLKSMGTPNPKEKATFFRLLAIMINAGIPLIKALDSIGEQTSNQKLKNTILEIARTIEKGGNFSDSMAHYPHVFAESHVGMIRSGEASGQLNNILKQLAIEMEKNAAISRKVRGAMMYPAFIIFVVIAVVAGMMIFVIPKITELFSQSDKALPKLTQIVIAMSDFIRFQWPWLLGGIIALIFGFIGARRTQQGRYATDWLALRIPAIGKIVQKSILTRFSRSLSNLLTSGIPIIQGLQILAKGIGNEVYKRRILLAADDVSRGIPLGECLRDSPEFPAMIVQMISVGEETAQLDNIALKIAEYYEDEVDTFVASLSKVMEPVILVVVGVIVGGIIGAIMMPIIQLTQVTGG